jgi:hypothetical protein
VAGKKVALSVEGASRRTNVNTGRMEGHSGGTTALDLRPGGPISAINGDTSGNGGEGGSADGSRRMRVGENGLAQALQCGKQI